MPVIDGKLYAFENLFWNENMLLDFLRVLQISEIVLEPGGHIFEHKQRCCEITYIISGAGYIYTDGTAMRAVYGDIHVTATGQIHKIIGDETEKLRYICIGFDFEDYPESFAKIAEFYKNPSAFLAKSEGDIRHLFDMLINESYQHTEEFEMTIENIIKLILIRVYQRFMSAPKKQLAKNASGKNSTVYRIINYININIHTVKSVREIASALNFTENYISHAFKANMGIALSSYIKRRKVQTACALIENKNMTLTEIAEILNFDSVQSLSRAFKAEYGKTPSQYIAELKKAEV